MNKVVKYLNPVAIYTIFVMLSACGGSSSSGETADTSSDNNLVATKVLSSAPESACPNGGITVNGGIDSNGNNELDSSEITSTQYVCNGTNSSSTLVQIDNEPVGENCIYGGKSISVGLDTNNDNLLSSDEISSQNYLCNGTNTTNGIDGVSSLVSIINEPAGVNCTDGGVKITSGIDINSNGSLDQDEEGTPSYVCTGPAGESGPAISPPMGVVAAGADGEVVLTWNENSADMITSSNVYWSTNPNITKTNSTILTGASSPYTISGLTNGTEYYFFVTGVSASGEGPASWPVMGAPGTPPDFAPENVTATPGDGINTINFTESADVSVSGYTVYRSLSPNVDASVGNIAPGYFYDTTTFIDFATNGTTYYYVVAAVNSYGESVMSDEVSATPQGTPPTPQNFAATPGDSQVALSWDVSPGAISYNIYRNGAVIASPADTDYIDTGLINGNYYEYYVTAVNAYGESCLGCSSQAALPPSGVAAAPTDVRATPGDGRVTVSWTPVADGSQYVQYVIYWSTSPGVTNASPNRIVVDGCCQPTPINSYTHTGITNGTQYYYVVAAMVNWNWEGPVSAEASAVPLEGGTSPITLEAVNITDTTASLSADINNPTGLTTTVWFEYGETASYGNTTQSSAYGYSGNISLSAVLTDLTQSTTYHYRVVTQNAAGTFYGNDRSFTTLNTPLVINSGETYTGLASDGTNIYYRSYNNISYTPIIGGSSAQLNTSDILWSSYPYYSNSVAVDEENVYVSSFNYASESNPDTYLIYKIDKSSGAVILMFSGLSSIVSIAVDQNYVYLLEINAIRKVDINTLEVIDVATGLSYGSALTINSQNIYWIDNEGIKTVSKTGGVITVLSPSTGSTIQVDESNIFWNFDGVSKMSLTGGTATPLVSTWSTTLSMDDTHIYFPSYDNSNSGRANRISRISKTGGDITTVSYAPGGVADLKIDNTNVYWVSEDRNVIYQSPK